MKNLIHGLLVSIIIASCVWAAEDAVPRKQRPTQPFMRQKLDYARGILEGITLERYDAVTTNAVALRNMALNNFFLTMGNQEYRLAITNFQSRVDTLLEGAKQKNLEASTDAYTRVVRGCVECHRRFRMEQFKPEDK